MKGYAMLRIGETGWIEKDRPECGPNDAIVRPLALSPCTSDVHTVWEGALGERNDMILGHEGCGVVVEVGEDSDVFGKIGEGDMITHVNGIEITNDDIVLDVIEDCKAGDTISLTVLLKNGNEQDFNVKLRANIGESSYSSVVGDREEPANDEQSGGGKFDFPFGE